MLGDDIVFCSPLSLGLTFETSTGYFFIFIGKSRKTIKILHRESNGLTMYVRKLSTGCFIMPTMDPFSRTCTINYSEFVHLILGEKLEIEGRFDENGTRLLSNDSQGLTKRHVY